MTQRAQFSLFTPAVDVQVIGISGTLDRIAGVRLLRLVAHLSAARDAPRLVLDLTAVDTVDRSGLRAVMIARRDARRYGSSLDLVGGPALRAALTHHGTQPPLGCRVLPTLEAALERHTASAGGTTSS
ncbi:MAG: STAS domain-containing protein [Pseudonocardia sp.]|nr:STAS domain-containing protein [Pseudonocardia sp.]